MVPSCVHYMTRAPIFAFDTNKWPLFRWTFSRYSCLVTHIHTIIDLIFSNRTWIRFPWLENNTFEALPISLTEIWNIRLFSHFNVYVFDRHGSEEKKKDYNFVKSHKFFRLILKFWMVLWTLMCYKSNFQTKTSYHCASIWFCTKFTVNIFSVSYSVRFCHIIWS